MWFDSFSKSKLLRLVYEDSWCSRLQELSNFKKTKRRKKSSVDTKWANWLESSVCERVKRALSYENIILRRIHWQWCVLHVWFEQHILLWSLCARVCVRVWMCVLHAIQRLFVQTCACTGVRRLCVFDWSSALSGSDVNFLMSEKHSEVSRRFIFCVGCRSQIYILLLLLLFFFNCCGSGVKSDVKCGSASVSEVHTDSSPSVLPDLLVPPPPLFLSSAWTETLLRFCLVKLSRFSPIWMSAF